MDIAKDPTQGVDPILAETPFVTCGGVQYPLRRLGMPDVFRLFRLYSKVIGSGGLEVGVKLKGVNIGGMDGFQSLVLMGFAHAESDLLEFFSSVLEVSVENLKNPRLFQMESFLTIAEGIARHPDALAFFARLRSGKAVLLPIGFVDDEEDETPNPVREG